MTPLSRLRAWAIHGIGLRPAARECWAAVLYLELMERQLERPKQVKGAVG